MTRDLTAIRQQKKMWKPLAERRRRERINHSLESLRVLLLESTRHERLRNPKLEKAEILEMAVQHLRSRALGHTDRSPVQSYESGFQGCLRNVSHFLEGGDSPPQPRAKRRLLLDHLPSPPLPGPASQTPWLSPPGDVFCFSPEDTSAFWAWPYGGPRLSPNPGSPNPAQASLSWDHSCKGNRILCAPPPPSQKPVPVGDLWRPWP